MIRRLASAVTVCTVMVMLFASSAAHAQTLRYVRAGATGSGTGADWTNAYSELNKITYSAGGTVYIAAGTYNTGLPSTSTSNVTIKRATVGTHGTDTGWQAAYDGQVTVTASATKFLDVSGGSGFTFDGVGGMGQPWKFHVLGHNSYDGKVQVEGATSATVRGLELDGAGCEPAIENGPEDGFRLGGNSNITIEGNYIHDFWYCSYSNVSNPGHSDAIQMPSAEGAEIRYNVIKNSGMLLFFGDCAWGNQWANNVRVHHNVLIQQAGVASNYRMIDMKGAGQTSSDYVKIENNTFYLASGFGGQSIYENGDCPANTSQRSIKNNIFVNGNFGLSSGYGTRSNNDYFGGDTSSSETGVMKVDPQFVSASGLDFHLQATSPVRDKGANLAYTQDIAGTAVPQSGVPDIGAYEYTSGATTSAPAPATNLQVAVDAL